MNPCSNRFILFQFITQDVKDQNRESQRRSRARRTEVMNDLKKQVESYQQQGAAASLEMQKVARAVALENRRLRDLLKIRGVSEDDIARHIAMPSAPASSTQASSYEPSSIRCRACGSTSIVAEKLPLSVPANTSCASSDISQQESVPLQPSPSVQSKPIQTPRTDKKIAIEVDPKAVALPPRSITSHEFGDRRHQKEPNDGHQSPYRTSCTEKYKDKVCDEEISLGSEAPLSTLRDPHDASKKEVHTDAMETSCDTAASILVDLHHHADTERARAALGCKGPSSCTVNNIKIFQLLENFS
ncbi:hypothetical protein TGAM01_v204082 [Trichoderma gamsii]|uniref:BZIP domain-containing protein n=1 Tax=Trichoderma gamsii TaxID=398673 RepID=A0A2P4ZSA6_9HYPO|nr:hypothetical protein TGAM01_v204082 [Trichoderma gamsii]PON27133.1 hypothetical protein TGAM01_v204082 [Trichoderma gamsii]